MYVQNISFHQQLYQILEKFMEENIWLDSAHTSAELGISEVILSRFRENGLMATNHLKGLILNSLE